MFEKGRGHRNGDAFWYLWKNVINVIKLSEIDVEANDSLYVEIKKNKKYILQAHFKTSLKTD